jgi:hypothetical protein
MRDGAFSSELVSTREHFLSEEPMAQYDKFAAEIWNGDDAIIAALQDMTSDDLHAIEKAIFGKYGSRIELNKSPAEVRSAIARARSSSDPSGKQTAGLDKALREANAEDS